MRIQHNMMAINANRNLGNNNSALSKELEKLSSGYQINRAGDNAAGLAISEKMRAQITCLDQAETNCNDGVSLIQTAEGALNEVHDMLNRMTELCEQSANGTYDDSVDRANLQSEVKQLISEIDRIASATNFNGITLLDGKLGGYALEYDTTGTNVTKVSASGGKASTTSELKLSITEANDPPITFGLCKHGNPNVTPATVNSAAVLQASSSYDTALKQWTVTIEQSSALTGTPTTEQQAILDAFVGMTLKINATGDEANFKVEFGSDIDGDLTEEIGKGLQLQIGDTADAFNQLTVAVKDMSSTGMTYTDENSNVVSVADIDISTIDGAVAGMAIAKNAINYVSSQRGTLGAMQNRLEHTINNLSTTHENITNAESRIRDTDMAAEMMAYTSKSILSQAAQSMLAQANQVPQQVLSLLQ